MCTPGFTSLHNYLRKQQNEEKTHPCFVMNAIRPPPKRFMYILITNCRHTNVILASCLTNFSKTETQ